MKISMKIKICTVSMLAILATFSAHAAPQANMPTAADAAEEVFDGARNYTVQVRVSISRPFEPDLRGTQRGAGFVIDAKRGWVLTNAHVVARSPSRIEVALHGQSYTEARKIYVDPHLDLAVIEIPQPAKGKLAQAELDCGDMPKVGHQVGAFGHPWNLAFTGTRGIISGITTRGGIEMLQTDAPINGGNSGGPLLSLRTGKIVGINTAQIRGSQNTNFAVGMKYACRIVDLLRAGKDPSPLDLRVAWFQDTDNEHALKVARNYGGEGALPFITGDTLVRMAGSTMKIENETQFNHLLRGRTGPVSLIVLRNGIEIELSGVLHPVPRLVADKGLVAGGVLFGPNPLRDADELKVGRVMVHHVDSGSDGEAKELARGDFLEFVNGIPVSSLQELHDLLAANPASVTLTLKRYGGSDRAFVYIERRLVTGQIEWIQANGVVTVSGTRNESPEKSPTSSETMKETIKNTAEFSVREDVEGARARDMAARIKGGDNP
jgi:S1-C subfamily serine protease